MMNENDEKDSDHEAMMDHCCMEAMQAIEEKDKEKFKDALEVLLGDFLSKMQANE